MLRKIWKSRYKILEGLWARITGKNRTLAEKRISICKGCKYYDKHGKSEMAVIKGEPACGICGCHLLTLVSCKSCTCSLEDINEKPLW